MLCISCTKFSFISLWIPMHAKLLYFLSHNSEILSLNRLLDFHSTWQYSLLHKPYFHTGRFERNMQEESPGEMRSCCQFHGNLPFLSRFVLSRLSGAVPAPHSPAEQGVSAPAAVVTGASSSVSSPRGLDQPRSLVLGSSSFTKIQGCVLSI